ncbi:unnamed protein product, partial [Prorocentrum cordatum]
MVTQRWFSLCCGRAQAAAEHACQEELELRCAALITAWARLARKLSRVARLRRIWAVFGHHLNELSVLRDLQAQMHAMQQELIAARGEAAQTRQAAVEARAAVPAQREGAAPAAERWAAEVSTIGKPEHCDGTKWRDWSVVFGAYAGATNPRMAEAFQRASRSAAPMFNATPEEDDVEISRQLHYWLAVVAQILPTPLNRALETQYFPIPWCRARGGWSELEVEMDEKRDLWSSALLHWQQSQHVQDYQECVAGVPQRTYWNWRNAINHCICKTDVKNATEEHHCCKALWAGDLCNASFCPDLGMCDSDEALDCAETCNDICQNIKAPSSECSQK